MMDWLANLATQDQSLEGLMARNQVEQRLGTTLNVAKLAQAQDAANQNRAEKEREFGLRQQEIEQARADRDAQTQWMNQNRKELQDRQEYNTLVDNLKPGMHMKAGPQLDLVRSHMPTDAFTPSEADPNDFIYMKHAYEEAELKNKQALEHQQQQDKLDQARYDLSKKEFEDRTKRANEAAALRTKQFEQKQKEYNEKMASVSAAGLGPAVKKIAEERIAAQTPLWDSMLGSLGIDTEDAQQRKEMLTKQAYIDAADAMQQGANKITGKTGASGGRGGPPTGLPASATGGNQIGQQKRFPNGNVGIWDGKGWVLQ